MQRIIHLFMLICTTAFVFGTAHATPVDDIRTMYNEAIALQASAAKARGKKKPTMLIRAAKKLARAYSLLVAKKLKNDAPDLHKKLQGQLDLIGKTPEIMGAIKETRTAALTASAAGNLTAAYDLFAKLRDLQPRNETVEYILGVIGQRMEAKR
ncbi:MAG: hypothetical protein VYA30_14460 [Myxococcota bacterium]|nr:hypothetical protein [Myxococcota bacterium]